jgi:hypothetical protein
MGKQWKRLRLALAKQCRKWAQSLDPVATMDEVAERVALGSTTFEVKRVMDGRKWSPYVGPSGARARDKFLRIKKNKEPGRMELVMDGVVRDTYQGEGK